MSYSSPLDERIGPDALVVTIAGNEVDLTDTGAVTIRHGRQQLDGLPVAGTCSLAVHLDALAQLPTIGDELTVELGPDALTVFGLAGPAAVAAGPRFRGRITDPSAQLSGGPRPGVVGITATTRRARLGGVAVGDAPWPAELDGARVVRILTALPVGLVDVGTIDPGTVTVLARDVDRQLAGQLLDKLAIDSGALLVERRDGALEWHDAEHRHGTVPSLTLDASDVLSPAKWAQQLGGLVNDLTVAYGPEPKAEVRVVDEVSADPVTGVGPLASRLDTDLADLDDASSLATLLVGRRSRPRYTLDALTVDLLRTLDPAQARALLQLEVGGLLAVTGFPAEGPLATAKLWLEGWTETITRNAWRTTLLVSAYGQTGPATRYADVPAAVTYADAPDDLSYLAAAGWDGS